MEDDVVDRQAFCELHEGTTELHGAEALHLDVELLRVDRAARDVGLQREELGELLAEIGRDAWVVHEDLRAIDGRRDERNARKRKQRLADANVDDGALRMASRERN